VEEINVGQYLAVLIRHWKLILITTLVGLAAAAAITLMTPPVYRASARLQVTPVRYQWRFDPRISQVIQVGKDERAAYLAAVAPSVLEQDTLEKLGQTLPAGRNPGDLAARVTMQAASVDQIQVVALAGDPAEAAAIANAWAESFVHRIAELYGQSISKERLTAELSRLTNELARADEALREFEAETGIALLRTPWGLEAPIEGSLLVGYEGLGSLGKQLELKSQTLAEHQVALDYLRFLIAEATRLKHNKGSTSQLPLELLQTPAIAAAGRLRSERILSSDLDEAIALLQAEEATISSSIAQLSAGVRLLQGQAAEMTLKLDQLMRQRQEAAENYAAVKRKITEIEISETVEGGPITILSPATKPASPALPRLRITIAVGGAAGLIVGMLGAFGLEYLDRTKK